MFTLKKIIALALLTLLLTGCAATEKNSFEESVPQLAKPSVGDTIAVFDTDKGSFKAVLFDDVAPKAVENFVSLANDGYYNGLPFHRVIADFLVQSGDDSGKGNGGKSVFGKGYEDEISKTLFHFTGAMGVAHKNANDNYSQFYVICGGDITAQLKQQMTDGFYPAEVVAAYSKVGGRPTLDSKYTIFGQVYEGLEVVKEISKVKTKDNDVPQKTVTIKTVTIEVYKGDSENKDEKK